MAKLTYKEQLLHPNWQRKRLLIMQRDGFVCTVCESGEKTLHVHHRQYIRGRMAWEYEDDDLVTLCEDCHAASHNERELLEAEVGRIESGSCASTHALLVGFRGGLVETEGVPAAYADSKLAPGPEASRYYWIGQIANRIGSEFDRDQVDVLYHAFLICTAEELIPAIRAVQDVHMRAALARIAAAAPAPEDDIG